MSGGWTPLHNSCERDSKATVLVLLRTEAKVNSQILNKMTLLHVAAQNGHFDVVKCLLERDGFNQAAQRYNIHNADQVVLRYQKAQANGKEVYILGSL